MKGMKRITTLLLAGSMALTSSACVRNDRMKWDDVALADGSEKALAHFLQVAEHLAPHIARDMLGDPVVQVGLSHSDQVG